MEPRPPQSAPGPAPTSGAALKTDIVVIGAGQAGLSSAYHLTRLGLAPHRGFAVLDQSPEPEGAWQHRWPSLPHAALARGDRLRIETNRIEVSARGVINATGTWESPHVPEISGADLFRGRQLHTKDYRTASEFAGQHVIVVGAGISAIQLLDEISRVTTTSWVTRRPPQFREGQFDEEAGRAAVALVEDRVRRGLPPASVVSVTGIPVTPVIEDMRERGVLERLPMVSGIA